MHTYIHAYTDRLSEIHCQIIVAFKLVVTISHNLEKNSYSNKRSLSKVPGSSKDLILFRYDMKFLNMFTLKSIFNWAQKILRIKSI